MVRGLIVIAARAHLLEHSQQGAPAGPRLAADRSLANRAPLIPVGTALFCRFLAALLVETADSAVVVAARVPIGLGALCFSLFSLVSVLESGIGDGADGEGEPEGSGTAADL